MLRDFGVRNLECRQHLLTMAMDADEDDDEDEADDDEHEHDHELLYSSQMLAYCNV